MRTRVSTSMSRWSVRGLVVACVLLLAGCGYAKRKDVDAQLSQLRSEMQQADQSQVAQIEATTRRLGELERALESLRSDFNVRIDRLQGEYEGLVTFDMPVHFEFNESSVREQDRPVLDKFAAVAQKFYGGSLITVEGFTDPAGSTAYNAQLGRERAESVKSYLVSQGLSESAVRTVSYGETRNRLIDPEATHDEPGALSNRRVAFVMDTRTMTGATVSSR
jgi:peptidoglycan-associated lipoprotein